MASKTFAVGHIMPRVQANIRKRVSVAWCSGCKADRILLDVVTWQGWPDGEAPTTGQCISCHSTISVTSTRPPEAA